MQNNVLLTLYAAVFDKNIIFGTNEKWTADRDHNRSSSVLGHFSWIQSVLGLGQENNRFVSGNWLNNVFCGSRSVVTTLSKCSAFVKFSVNDVVITWWRVNKQV